MLDKIKTLLFISDNDKDDLLSLLLDLATEEAKQYTHLDDVTKLESVILLMVAEKYNKLGADGLTGRSFSGVSESYESDYSSRVRKLLNSIRHIRTV